MKQAGHRTKAGINRYICYTFEQVFGDAFRWFDFRSGTDVCRGVFQYAMVPRREFVTVPKIVTLDRWIPTVKKISKDDAQECFRLTSVEFEVGYLDENSDETNDIHEKIQRLYWKAVQKVAAN